METKRTKQKLLTQKDLSRISMALLNTVDADVKKAGYEEQTDEELLTLAQQHLPAFRARRIFVSEDILVKENFEAGVCQQYAIIYKGLVVGRRVLQYVDALQAFSKRPYLNRIQITVGQLQTLPSEEQRTKLKRALGSWFINSVADCGKTFELDIFPIIGYQAYNYMDHCVRELLQEYPTITIEIKPSHREE